MKYTITFLITFFTLTLFGQTELDTLLFKEINKIRISNSLDTVELTSEFYDNVLNHNKSMYVYSMFGETKKKRNKKSESTKKRGLSISHNEYIENDTIDLNCITKRYKNTNNYGEIVSCAPYKIFRKETINEKAVRLMDYFMKSTKGHKEIILTNSYKKTCVSSYCFDYVDNGVEFQMVYITIVFYN